MKRNQTELNINYDEFNRQSMLNGCQLEMLERLCKERDPQIFNIIAIYYLYKKYWSKEMLEVIKNDYSDLIVNLDADDDQILEELSPNNFFNKKDWNWEKLKQIIEIMKIVRVRLKKDQTSNLINNN